MDKDFVDPDGGVNLAKKRKVLGVAEVFDPEINENFPSGGFQCGIALLPRISFSHSWKDLIEEVELRKKLATEKPIAKGCNFYKSGHVRQFFKKKKKGINSSLKRLFSYLWKREMCTRWNLSFIIVEILLRQVVAALQVWMAVVITWLQGFLQLKINEIVSLVIQIVL